MAQKSIVLTIDEKATSALALATTAEADAQQALTDAAAASAAAAAALAVPTRMYWGNAKGAGSVTAADLVTSVEKPLIVNASSGDTIGPFAYTILTSNGYTVNTVQNWSSVIHLINKSGGVLKVKLGDPTLVVQELQIDGTSGGPSNQGEPVAIWYNNLASVWEMASSAV